MQESGSPAGGGSGGRSASGGAGAAGPASGAAGAAGPASASGGAARSTKIMIYIDIIILYSEAKKCDSHDSAQTIKQHMNH